MAAPQQTATPIFNDTHGVPNPQVNYHRMDPRDTPGYALANLLGALPDAAKQYQKNQEPVEPSPEEKAQLAALAKIGADKTNVRIAKGDNVFGIMKSKDATMDSYELSRGQTDADLWAGGLRDRYNASGLAENDDPKAFEEFASKERADMLRSIQKNDPSYYHGFITKIAPAFEEMALAHTGNLDKFIPAKRKRAAEMDIEGKTRLEMSIQKEKTAVQQFLGAITEGEAVSYDARHSFANGDGTHKFTEMTLDEVLRWQASGAWKRDGGSSAVGKHQFIRSTLLELVRESGLDPKTTKFTPQVQDQLIMNRLLKTRGLGDYLAGKISVEEFIDGNGLRPDQKGFRGGLKHELASIQGTDGKGQYDGDGKNHAGIPARKAIAAAMALKDAILRDPAKLKQVDGKWVLDDSPGTEDALQENPQMRVAPTIDSAETTYGVSQKEARSYAANSLIKMMEADPSITERMDLEDKMSDWKLSQEQRERVAKARDRIREETSNKAAIAQKEKTSKIVASASEFIRTGDLSTIEELKSLDYEAYNKLLLVQSGKFQGDYDLVDRKTYLGRTEMFDAPDFEETATNDYLNGGITKDTYLAAIDHYKTVQAAKPVLELPGIDDFLDGIEVTLPESTRKTFRKALATAVADLQKANDGERPSLDVVMDQITNIHARFQAASQQKVQSAKDRLTAQDQQVPNG